MGIGLAMKAHRKAQKRSLKSWNIVSYHMQSISKENLAIAGRQKIKAES